MEWRGFFWDGDIFVLEVSWDGEFFGMLTFLGRSFFFFWMEVFWAGVFYGDRGYFGMDDFLGWKVF